MGKTLESYQQPVCFPKELPFENNELPEDFPKPGQCVNGEPDLERFMRNTSHNPEHLKFIWKIWHDNAGYRVKDDYYIGVLLQNSVAKKSGIEINDKLFESLLRYIF